jgi:predicted O-methyltransferase YrrM
MRTKIRSVLAELEKRSSLEKSRKVHVSKQDRMLAITKDTGMLFHSLLVGMNAKNALELGTSTGYSTLWIADALLQNHKNPQITTIEGNPSKIIRARRNFERAGVSKFIKIREGRILDVLRKIPKKQYDFVLIDADKENVKKYFDLVLPLVKIGGIIATDNILHPKKYRRTMRDFIKYVSKKRNVRTFTIRIGNGEEISFRI